METSPLISATASNFAVEDGCSSVSSDATPTPTGTVAGAAAAGADADRRLWEELEKPWPSTYERSIALLASPVVQRSQVELFTKSPKPGSTPAALARRRDLRRGFYTPDLSKMIRPAGALSGRSLMKGVESGGGDDDDEAIASAREQFQKLDLRSQKQQLRETQEKQQQRAAEAKRYREKVLKQSNDDGYGLKSPGYLKEVALRSSRPARKGEGADAASIQDGKSSFAQCVFNLANILMGVGLLGLPFALKSAGWVGGLGCLLIFGFICWRTAILIGRELNGDPRPSNSFVDSPYKTPLLPRSVPEARILPPIRSFPDIARAAFGETGCFVLSVILYFELFSCVCIFFVTIGDHLHQLFPSIPASTHLVVVGGISMVPTIVLRTPALLSYLSMVGTFATIAVVASVVASALVEGDISVKVAAELHPTNATAGESTTAAPLHVMFNDSGLAMAFGLVAYCFSGHAIVPSIYTSMREPQRFEAMVTYTFVIVVSMCVAVGVSGYYMFGESVLDQVTLSLERNSKAVGAMKVLTWLMVMTGA
jgi:solute carrier family 32 (vesicular inhibitory amino acid transporter)